MISGPPDPVLEVDSISKTFGEHRALASVSFAVGSAERLALLGPNGAGKTTLIRALAGRVRIDGGEIRLHRRPIDARGVRDALGWVPQEIALYADLTTRENLTAFGRFHGLTGGALRRSIDWALAWTGLTDRAGSLVGGFSGGMKRRVNLACGCLHRPGILLLDEPTVGVDPQSRQKIFTMLDELSADGTAIVLTTHHLDEAQSRSDRIVILDHGRVVADGTFDELIEQSVGSSRMIRLRIDRPLEEPLVLAGEDPTRGPVQLGSTGEDLLTTRINDLSGTLPQLLRGVQRCGYEVADMEVQAPSLHHVFLHLTGHELRDD